jgi:hypothetical protein
MWRHFIGAIPDYDLVLAYRIHNLEDFKKAGAKRVELLRSWFDPTINYPVELTEEEKKKYKCDVVFIGHYEDDMRLQCLEKIKEMGYNLKVFGHDYGWHPALKNSSLSSLIPLSTVWGADYNKALAGAKVALCFFSELNRDTYTRRCFEIPASGTLMISQYSDDIATLFKKGVEADYFKGTDELIALLDIYLNNNSLLESTSLAGYQRVTGDGHDVSSRMKQLLVWVNNIPGEI